MSKSKSKGYFVSAGVVRATVGVLAAVVVAIVVSEAPEVWRYYRLATM